MFTGIIRNIGIIDRVTTHGNNTSFWVRSELVSMIRVDQSIAHDGVCLTVEDLDTNQYKVTAIDATLQKTNLRNWKTGTIINLELAMTANQLLDGHMVQGHIDKTLSCLSIEDKNGSKDLTFEFEPSDAGLLVPQGSVCINGISLTISNLTKNTFTVSIIPYTWENTNLKSLKTGDLVNVEFDILGKYIRRNLKPYLTH